MDERYIATIDLGSSKTALAVARIEDEDIQIVFYDEAPSDGIRYSSIFNPQKAVEPVRHLLNKAEDELGIKIIQAGVGLPRFYVKQQTATGEVPRSDTGACITQEEVDNLKDMALDNYPLDNPEKDIIYSAIPQSFTADDYLHGIESDIIGMVSERLEGNFKVFIGSQSKAGNIDKLFNDLGIAVANKYFIPEVMADVILSREEIENGVALIDFGAGVTSVSIYQGGIMRHYGAIPFGGNSVTNDIKLEGSFSNRLAENIKLAFGACMPDKLASMSEKVIRVVNRNSGREKDLSVRYLSEIITSREREILDAILYEIQQSGYADFLRSGIVITGGGAEMANLGNYIHDISGYNVRTGYPLKKYSATGCSGVFETGATSCMGMILAAKKEKYNCAEAISHKPDIEELHEEEVEELILTNPEKEDTIWKDSKPAASQKPKKTRTHGTWVKIEKIGESLGSLFNNSFDALDSDE